MLTSCPNCSHVFSHPRCCEVQQSASTLVLQATLQLSPRSSETATCAFSVTQPGVGVGVNQAKVDFGFSQPKLGLAAMTGGGIVLTNVNSGGGGSVILQQQEDWTASRVPVNSPQPSPSTPLSFVLPTTATSTTCTVPSATSKSQVWQLPIKASMLFPSYPPEVDLNRMATTKRRLQVCGFYYESLSWQESVIVLQDSPLGTFLIRDSSDSRFIYSLSVQTDRGPTSVRLQYEDGRFRLDAVDRMVTAMPQFECVLDLIEYYVDATKKVKKKKGKDATGVEQVWIDALGRVYANIYLSGPLYKKEHIPSLQHLARLAINRQIKTSTVRHTNPFLHPSSLLPLPAVLLDYMKDYPYSH